MGILENFPLTHHTIDDPQMWHVVAQASRAAFADRERYAADADFVDVPLKSLLDKRYLAQRAKSIDIEHDGGIASPLKLSELAYADDDAFEMPSTSHFVVADQYGNVLSMTTSIEMGFGSSIMVGGFLLNNQLTDFSLSPEINGLPVANRVEANKRPRSSMSPMIVFKDDKPYLLIGSPGGTRIINYVTKSLIGILDFGMDVQSAINLPNISQTNGIKTIVEKNAQGEIIAKGLEKYGHQVSVQDINSGLHAIQLKDGKLYGGADPRREGRVLGK
jgi:gamma-glutamyltranspeptidase/glutathione hydrolase